MDSSDLIVPLHPNRCKPLDKPTVETLSSLRTNTAFQPLRQRARFALAAMNIVWLTWRLWLAHLIFYWQDTLHVLIWTGQHAEGVVLTEPAQASQMAVLVIVLATAWRRMLLYRNQQRDGALHLWNLISCTPGKVGQTLHVLSEIDFNHARSWHHFGWACDMGMSTCKVITKIGDC